MEYHGQRIYEFNASREQIITSQTSQIHNLAKFLAGSLLIVILLTGITQWDSLDSLDLILLGLASATIIVGYYIFSKQLTQRYKEIEDQELIFYEYGINFPPLATRDREISHPQYVPYNNFVNIRIEPSFINFETDQTNFFIDLIHFPYTTEHNYDEEINLLIDLVSMIKDNLDKVENRDHPTVIPRSYFRDVLP